MISFMENDALSILDSNSAASSDFYTLAQGLNCLKTIPFTARSPYIFHITFPRAISRLCRCRFPIWRPV